MKYAKLFIIIIAIAPIKTEIINFMNEIGCHSTFISLGMFTKI